MNDFGGNLFFGAIPQTLMGLSVIIPYISTTIQGWIGGIAYQIRLNKHLIAPQQIHKGEFWIKLSL